MRSAQTRSSRRTCRVFLVVCYAPGAMGLMARELVSSLLGLWLLLCSLGCPGSAELRAPPDKIGR